MPTPQSVAHLARTNPENLTAALAATATVRGLHWLRTLEQQVYALIEERYREDPGDLWNTRYRQGRQRLRAMQRVFDEAFDRLPAAAVEAVVYDHQGLLDVQAAATDTRVYNVQHPLERRKAEDAAADERLLSETEVQQTLASNWGLQRELVQDDAELRRDLARKGVDQPHEQTMARIEVSGKQLERQAEAERQDKTDAKELRIKELETHAETARALAQQQTERFKALAQIMGGGMDQATLRQKMKDLLDAMAIVDAERDTHTPLYDPQTKEINFDELRRRGQQKEKYLTRIFDRHA